MKTKLFYLLPIIILFCGCEKKMVCNCGEGFPLELGGHTSRFTVVELKNEDLINHIYVVPYVVPGTSEVYNEFANIIPSSICDNSCPFIHIAGNNYLVDWNWLVSYRFYDNLNEHYLISNKWEEWHTIDALKGEKINKKLIKRVKFIFAHTINDFIKNKNIDITIEEYFHDNFNVITNSIHIGDNNAIITEKEWNNVSQEEKERYLEIFDSYNKNYNNAVEALKYILAEEDSKKYFIY